MIHILCLLLLNSAIGDENEDSRIELRLWNIPLKTAMDPVNVARRRVFDEFCKRHPEVRVKALVPLRIEGPAAEGNEFLAVAGGVAPDVFYLFGRKIGDYNNQKFLLPLNEYLQDYKKRYGNPYSGIAAPSHIWELCYDNGNIIAVPGGYYSLALVCYNTYFSKRGLAGKFPRDWDELYEYARHLTVDPLKEPNGNPNEPVVYGLFVQTGLYAGWHYLQYVWSAGGDVVQSYLKKDGILHPVPSPPVDFREYNIRLSNETQYYDQIKKQIVRLKQEGLPTDYSTSDLEWKLETDKKEAIEAILFFRKIAHQPWLRNGDHEFDITPEMTKSRKAVDPVTGDVFDLDDPSVKKRIYHGVCAAADLQSGIKLTSWQYAMAIGGIGEVNNADPRTSTYIPFPSRKGFPPAAFIAGHYLGVNAAIVPDSTPGRKNVEAIQEVAWKYIEFQTGPIAEKITVDTFIEYGLAGFIRPALLESAGYNDILSRVEPEQMELWKNLIQYARVEPYNKGFTHVMTRELGMVIEAAFSDRPDPLTGEYSRDLAAIMQDTCDNANTMIMGRMPDEEIKKRTLIGWIIFIFMALALIVGSFFVVKLAMLAQSKFDDSEGFGVGGHPARKRLFAWLLLTPAVATIAIWNYYPLARGLVMAFQDFKILGGSTYVGLQNFVEAVSEPKFWRYLLQTFQYMLMLVGLGFCMPIILALLLTEIPRFKVIYRTIYYLPAVTTGMVTLFLWKCLLFDPTHLGVLNQFILYFNSWPVWLVASVKIGVFVAAILLAYGFGLQATKDYNTNRGRWITGILSVLIVVWITVVFWSLIDKGGISYALKAFIAPFDFKLQAFLRDPDMALFWLVIPVIWAGAGPGCLIYLAALKGIPEDQYEAAEIDGAGIWAKIMHVMIPNLKALIIINFIGAVIAGFKESGNIFVMTGGGPEDATMTIGLYIWYNAFMFLNFGLSTSMAWIMGSLLIGFTLFQLRILNKLQFQNVAANKLTK